MNIYPANIPSEMKEKKQWLLWKGIKQGDKVRKIPFTVDGKPASSTDSGTWSSFITCLQESKGYDGIGFVFNNDFVGVDLDHCVNGHINEFASGVLDKVQSYTEYSPSKTGLHIICRAEIAQAIKRPEIEIYKQGRYFTITGDIVEGRREIRQVRLGGLVLIVTGKQIMCRPVLLGEYSV